MTLLSHLNDRAIIAISGPEASGFLQGLITNDVESLAEGSPAYAALLTPQGKILFDFLLVRRKGELLLDCRADLADALAKRLLLYRLRSKVVIERREDMVVLAAWNESALRGFSFPDPRLTALGRRAIISRDDVPPDSTDAALYLAHRLDCGVPEGSDFSQDKIFALDAGLDELHGVSFDKGCYVGQELTARMKHRGTARKRLLPVSSIDGSALPVPGTSVGNGTHDLGDIVSSYGSRGFALVRLDRLAENDGSELRAAGARVHITLPAWLSA
jgi:folate-binding protein YgfZ